MTQLHTTPTNIIPDAQYQEKLFQPKPPQLIYEGPRLRGQATTFTQWQIYPNSSNQFWQTNAIVKIMSNTSAGLIDWYRTHLQFQVQVPIQWVPVGGLQVDCSAYSAIKSFVISQNSMQLERIMDHDVLLSYLVDTGYSQLVSVNKQGMGISYNNFPEASFLSGMSPNSQTTMVPSLLNTGFAGPAQLYQQHNMNSYNPTLCPWNGGISIINTSDASYNVINVGGTVPSHQSITNPLVFPQGNTAGGWLPSKAERTGRFSNIRAQYKYFCNKNTYPDSVQSYPLSSPSVSNQSWLYSNFTTGVGYNKNNPYELNFAHQSDCWGGQNFQSPGCGITGYGKPIAPDFSRGCFQPMISPTIPQCQMSYGKIQQYPTPVSKRRFRIPMASSICGINIPPDQFKLFPVEMYENLLLQLTMNPYFMFSTGYSDVHQCDLVGMSYQIPRKWKYNQIKWVWHIYSIATQDMAQYMEAVMYRPITFSSRYWQMLIQFQVPTGQNVKQTNQIPCNVQSLSQIVILFLSNQYLSYTGCRKQFRLSNNITSMQLKANTVYYPVQPILGNAGNPEAIDQTGDNWNFLQPIYLSNNYLFSTNFPCPRINSRNFAINSRIYDTTATGTLYNSSIVKTTSTDNALSQLSSLVLDDPTGIRGVNADTAMGQSWFHQNRYRGTAAFVYSFQPYGFGKSLVNGVNTIIWKQFQVTFNAATTNYFPYDQTQYVFAQSDILVSLQRGRGIGIKGI